MDCKPEVIRAEPVFSGGPADPGERENVFLAP